MEATGSMEHQLSEHRNVLLAGVLKTDFNMLKLTFLIRNMLCVQPLHSLQRSWGLGVAWYGMSHAGGYSWSEVVV